MSQDLIKKLKMVIAEHEGMGKNPMQDDMDLDDDGDMDEDDIKGEDSDSPDAENIVDGNEAYSKVSQKELMKKMLIKKMSKG